MPILHHGPTSDPSTPADGALYAVLHDTEWHLATWCADYADEGAFRVVGNQMQCGDAWILEWIDRFIFIAESA